MYDMKVGLQLYSIRDDMENDMDAALGAVKEMGYDYVEFAGYFGKSAEEIAELLKKHDLKCISVHQTYDLFVKEGQNAVDYLKTIGAEYSAIPWMGLESHKGAENHEKAVEDIKKVADLLKENGIQLLYHNHDFEFNKYEDKYLLEWLCEEIGLELMKPELDTCWVHYAGVEPAGYIRKFAGHVPVLHLKDFACEKLGGGPVYALISSDGTEGKKASKEDTGFDFRPCGDGIQDFKAILDAAVDAGTKYLIVEQDVCNTATPLESVKRSREYLKSLGV